MSKSKRNLNLANKAPSTVPKASGRMSGLAGFASSTKPRVAPSKITIPKLGSKMNFPQQGKVRKGKK